MTYLALKLRELCEAERRMTLEEKARAAYVHGAEEQSRKTLGRPLTQEELERVLGPVPLEELLTP